MNKLDWLKKQGFIIRLQGNDYVLYKGLVALAHEMGLKSIVSEPIQIDWDAGRFVFQATVTMLDEAGHEKVFVDYGDCTKHNTNKMIYPAALRMASTRARGRALRDATGVALTTHEELPN